MSTCAAAYRAVKAVWILVCVDMEKDLQHIPSEEELSSTQQVVGASLGLAGAVVGSLKSTG